MAVTRIPSPAAKIAFLQIWDSDSAKSQEGWLGEMRANVHLLQTKPGFVSMTLHHSLDYKNVCVYAQWLDLHHLESAVGDPLVQAARAKLDRWAQPDGRAYLFHSLIRPPNSNQETLELCADHGISFVNVWRCGDSTRQKMLLAAMEDAASLIATQTGFVGMALHTSIDESHVGVYARWQSLSMFRSAIEERPQAQRERVRLSSWGEPRANAFVVDGVYLPLS